MFTAHVLYNIPQICAIVIFTVMVSPHRQLPVLRVGRLRTVLAPHEFPRYNVPSHTQPGAAEKQNRLLFRSTNLDSS